MNKQLMKQEQIKLIELLRKVEGDFYKFEDYIKHETYLNQDYNHTLSFDYDYHYEGLIRDGEIRRIIKINVIKTKLGQRKQEIISIFAEYNLNHRLFNTYLNY